MVIMIHVIIQLGQVVCAYRTFRKSTIDFHLFLSVVGMFERHFTFII